jgi:hypothetical protein
VSNQVQMELQIIREQGVQSTKIANIESDIQDMQKKLDTVVAFVHETKGGHRFLWGVLTIAATIGATIGSLSTYFFK